ncbi:hypothetical protein AVEN_190334-1 [Araneus ventricosus]|uniref:Integrase catalytic domain-containing protein n=1 Tax=Araneus ventricosus TaxID=182803 RepID=A0A4Y2GRG7_ARAVE|nr:hypothetical protein AVEN_190334-1 [Araneus ventricosus]
MNETYQDPSHPASFGGVDALHRALGRKVSRKEIKKFLEGFDAYTLPKSIRKKFSTNKVIVYSIDQQWQADLVDLSSLSKYNKGSRYLLYCIDVLSKYARIVPLKQKRGKDILEAFKIIFSHRKPNFYKQIKGRNLETLFSKSFSRKTM